MDRHVHLVQTTSLLRLPCAVHSLLALYFTAPLRSHDLNWTQLVLNSSTSLVTLASVCGGGLPRLCGCAVALPLAERSYLVGPCVYMYPPPGKRRYEQKFEALSFWYMEWMRRGKGLRDILWLLLVILLQPRFICKPWAMDASVECMLALHLVIKHTLLKYIVATSVSALPARTGRFGVVACLVMHGQTIVTPTLKRRHPEVYSSRTYLLTMSSAGLKGYRAN